MSSILNIESVIFYQTLILGRHQNMNKKYSKFHQNMNDVNKYTKISPKYE